MKSFGISVGLAPSSTDKVARYQLLLTSCTSMSRTTSAHLMCSKWPRSPGLARTACNRTDSGSRARMQLKIKLVVARFVPKDAAASGMDDVILRRYDIYGEHDMVNTIWPYMVNTIWWT